MNTNFDPFRNEKVYSYSSSQPTPTITEVPNSEITHSDLTNEIFTSPLSTLPLSPHQFVQLEIEEPLEEELSKIEEELRVLMASTEAIQSIETNAPSKPLALFVYTDERSIEGVINSLKKEFKEGIFITEPEAENFIQQHSQHPLSIFYIQRFDCRVGDNDFEFYLPKIETTLSHSHVHLTFIGASKTFDESVEIESNMGVWQNKFQKNSNRRINQIQTLAIRFDNNNLTNPKTLGSVSKETDLFENINKILKNPISNSYNAS